MKAVFVTILSFCLLASVQAQKTVSLKEKIYAILVDDELEVLESVENISIDELLADTTSFIFKATLPQKLAYNTYYWSRINVENKTQEDLAYLIGYRTARQADFWDAFVLESGKIIEFSQTGRLLDFNDRAFSDGHHTYLKLNLPKGKTYTLYFRQYQQTQAFAPQRLEYVFMPYEGFLSSKSGTRLYQGIYLGFILVMLFYNLFVYFSVKDIAYLYYVLFLLGAFLVSMQLFGLGMESLWSNLPQVDIYFNLYLIPIWSSVYIVFVQRYLHTKELIPAWHKFLSILAVICFLWVGVAIVGQEWVLYACYALTVVVMLLNIITGILTWLKGFKTSGYFLAANVLFIIGVVMYILRAVNLIPTTLLTTYGIQLGSGLEMLLFSLGLADKINRMQDELYQAKLEKESFAREKEEEEKKLIEIQKKALEEEILIRTKEVVIQKNQIEEQNLRLAKALEVEHLQMEEVEATNAKLKKALEQLKSTQAQLVHSEKMASLGLMTAGIAHEINNPLNFIYAGSETLEDLISEVMLLLKRYEQIEEVYQDQSKVEQLLREIHQTKSDMEFDLVKEDIYRMIKEVKVGAERASEIISGLRLFARGEKTSFQKVNVHELIKTALMLLKNVLKDNVEVISSYDETIDLIECHPSQLTQVFMNLIANGAQAIKGNGKIYITTQQQDHQIEIRIQDTGKGIPEEIKNKIFEPFYTTKEVGKGTGLGLSISYGIIENHHGTIAVNSKVGKGTEFVVTIPCSISGQ